MFPLARTAARFTAVGTPVAAAATKPGARSASHLLSAAKAAAKPGALQPSFSVNSVSRRATLPLLHASSTSTRTFLSSTYERFSQAFTSFSTKSGHSFNKKFINTDLAEFIRTLSATGKDDGQPRIETDGKHRVLVIPFSKLQDPKFVEHELKKIVTDLIGQSEDSTAVYFGGDTPGAYGVAETEKAQAVMDQVMDILHKQGATVLYGTTGFYKDDDTRAGVNALLTRSIDKRPELATSVLGLTVGQTADVIEKYGAATSESLTNYSYVLRESHEVGGKKVEYSQFGADANINRISDIGFAFSGGNQTLSEVTKLLKSGAIVLGISGLRGENNPDCNIKGEQREFLDAAELIGVLASQIADMQDKGLTVTAKQVDNMIRDYIFGKATPFWPSSPSRDPKLETLDKEPSIRRHLYNRGAYDAHTKFELFVQARRYLLDPEVYNTLPDRAVILPAERMDELPKIAEHVLHDAVPARYFNAPIHHMTTVVGEPGSPVAYSDEAFEHIRKTGFFSLTVPADRREEAKRHFDVLRAFSKTFIEQGYGPEINADRLGLVSPITGHMVDNVHPKAPEDQGSETADDTSTSSPKNQNFRTSLVESPGNNQWKHFPLDVQEALHFQKEMAVAALQGLLLKMGITKADFDKITGGAAVGKGDSFGAFNGFNLDIDALKAGMKESGEPLKGLNAHEDWSWLTALISNDPGLMAKIAVDGSDDLVWHRVQSDDPYTLIINVGTSLEELTQQLPTEQRFKAIEHFVTRCGFLRSSIALFLDHQAMRQMFEINANGDIVPSKRGTFLDYALDQTKETYDRTRDMGPQGAAPLRAERAAK